MGEAIKTDSFDLETVCALLKMQSDAMVLVHGRVIAFVNEPAAALLCGDCTGERAAKVLPPSLTNLQSGTSVAAAPIAGQYLTVSVSTVGLDRLYTLRPLCLPTDAGRVPAQAWTNLASLRLLSEQIMTALDETGIAENRRSGARLIRLYFQIRRQLTNEAALEGFASGSLPFQPQVTECALELRRLLPLLRRVLEERGIELRCDVQEGAYYCKLDGVLMNHALLNLLQGCVSRCRRGDYIRLSLQCVRDQIMLTIHDSGEGSRLQALHTVLSGGTSDAARGMAVTLGAAQKHGCTLTMESSPALGTTVRLQMAAAEPPRRVTLRRPRKDDDRRIEQALLTAFSPTLPPEAYQNVDLRREYLT